MYAGPSTRIPQQVSAPFGQTRSPATFPPTKTKYESLNKSGRVTNVTNIISVCLGSPWICLRFQNVTVWTATFYNAPLHLCPLVPQILAMPIDFRTGRPIRLRPTRQITQIGVVWGFGQYAGNNTSRMGRVSSCLVMGKVRQPNYWKHFPDLLSLLTRLHSVFLYCMAKSSGTVSGGFRFPKVSLKTINICRQFQNLN